MVRSADLPLYEDEIRSVEGAGGMGRREPATYSSSSYLMSPTLTKLGISNQPPESMST